MAAPTVRSSQQHATFKGLTKKEKKSKVTHKHVLCSDTHEWPRPSTEVQTEILAKLSEQFQQFPNLFKKLNNPSTEQLQLKSKIRSQLDIGTSCVFRSLEKDSLACVLVSGQAKPAITVNHVILLAQDKGCPVICIDQLSPTLAKLMETKCLPLTIGFKKIQDSVSEFSELIKLIQVRSTTPVAQNSAPVSRDVRGGVMLLPDKFRPIRVEVTAEAEILNEMKRVFLSLAVGNKEKTQNKKKKKKSKKNRDLKDYFDKTTHNQFELGKKTVLKFAERGSLEMILISEEIVHVLLSESELSSLLCVAHEKSCPVIVLPGLVETFQSLCQGCVSVLGFKKSGIAQSDGKNYFQGLMTICLDAIARLEPSPLVPSCPETVNPPVVPESKVETDPEEEEDYSYLYVLKSESKELQEVKSSVRSEMEELKKDQNFISEFISLSGNSDGRGTKSVITGIKAPVKKSGTEMSEKLNTSIVKDIDVIRTRCADVKTPTSVKNVLSKSLNCSPTQLLKQRKVQDETLAANDCQPTAGDFIAFSSPTLPSALISKDEVIMKVDGIDNEVKSMGADSEVKATITDERVKPPIVDDAVVESNSTKETPLSSISRKRCFQDGKLSELMTAGLNTAKYDGPMFTVDSTGDLDLCKKFGKETKRPKNDPDAALWKKKDSDVLGLKELQKSGQKVSVDYLALAQSSKPSKKGVKRKQLSEEGYISLTYNEANIKTMTSNLERKKRKKKRKKD